ncbi:hypothetical protein BDP81DRAFT_418658 [Colletotrichum phormii]|uniref:Uncharacterized protein n=1 Tax=Colletotrichum phormii TaxID=359342 RepID=A0AAJ0A003_9PEZI|nr:uncharacterized protein BDP81DRAFT_418658 [Colletotrichum phormii]KAK1641323.1 hypothetical protein BDP81DRAFT_418658 [Colletotrichum phormii]
MAYCAALEIRTRLRYLGDSSCENTDIRAEQAPSVRQGDWRHIRPRFEGSWSKNGSLTCGRTTLFYHKDRGSVTGCDPSLSAAIFDVAASNPWTAPPQVFWSPFINPRMLPNRIACRLTSSLPLVLYITCASLFVRVPLVRLDFGTEPSSRGLRAGLSDQDQREKSKTSRPGRKRLDFHQTVSITQGKRFLWD